MTSSSLRLTRKAASFPLAVSTLSRVTATRCAGCSCTHTMGVRFRSGRQFDQLVVYRVAAQGISALDYELSPQEPDAPTREQLQKPNPPDDAQLTAADLRALDRTSTHQLQAADAVGLQARAAAAATFKRPESARRDITRPLPHQRAEVQYILRHRDCEGLAIPPHWSSAQDIDWDKCDLSPYYARWNATSDFFLYLGPPLPPTITDGRTCRMPEFFPKGGMMQSGSTGIGKSATILQQMSVVGARPRPPSAGADPLLFLVVCHNSTNKEQWHAFASHFADMDTVMLVPGRKETKKTPEWQTDNYAATLPERNDTRRPVVMIAELEDFKLSPLCASSEPR